MAPEELLILLKLAAARDADATVRELERELQIPKSSVFESLRRLEALGLLKHDAGGRRIDRLGLRDLLVHGARWVAPAKIGEAELGIPTAHSAPPLVDKLRGDDDPLVIPMAHGPMRGRAVPPLHKNAAYAAQRDPRLYRLLALCDAFRIGRARDREVAAAELDACL